MPSTASADAPPTRRSILHRGSAGMIVGGLIAVVGSLLPWVTTPIGALYGTAGPGLWTLSAGFLALAGALLPYRKVAIAHSLAPGFFIAAIVAWQLVRLIYLSSTTDAWGQLLPGIGLVLAAGGAVILLRTGFRIVSATENASAA